AMIVVVPFSRLYLGVHFPLDIVGGLVIGASTIIAFFFLYRALDRFPLERYYWAAVAALTVAPLVFCAFTEASEMVQFMGALVGFGAGSFLEARFVRFDETGGALFQAAKMAACFAGLALIMAVFVAIPFGGKYLDFVSNLAAGGWISCVLPYCVRRFRGALRERDAVDPAVASGGKVPEVGSC
ncbi:MAG TPA: phosphatase PAP2 family protein, partial [bacterium]|nr:phosphatase PAP2 family protein [bacterium]